MAFSSLMTYYSLLPPNTTGRAGNGSRLHRTDDK